MIQTFPQIPAVVSPLDQLDLQTKPLWGQMSAQHMIEHLSLIVRISNGKMNVPQATPEEKIPSRLAFLRSDMELPREFKAPGLAQDPLPLRFASMEAAREKLEAEITDFIQFFDENPNSRPVHPVFGPLDRADWVRFHNKHFTHHYKQFGLI
jgi:hydroxymethylglutaryl-CoA reductase